MAGISERDAANGDDRRQQLSWSLSAAPVPGLVSRFGGWSFSPMAAGVAGAGLWLKCCGCGVLKVLRVCGVRVRVLLFGRSALRLLRRLVRPFSASAAPVPQSKILSLANARALRRRRFGTLGSSSGYLQSVWRRDTGNR